MPSRFNSRAKWLDESESAMNPVRGDFVTTANFAVVVRPVPTRGALVKMSGLAGDSGSTPAGAYSWSRVVPRPTPPEVLAKSRLFQRPKHTTAATQINMQEATAETMHG
jgi:hypothetical protein